MIKIKLEIINFKLEIPANPRLGQSLIEVLIAMALASILLPAILTGIVASREGKAQEDQRLRATGLLQEAEEAVRSVREKGWNENMVNGTYYPTVAVNNSWSFSSGSQEIDGFTREILIENANRDSAGNIAESGTEDSSTKKVTSKVSWNSPIASQVQSISYLQRYVGNDSFNHTSQTDFSGGAHNNTTHLTNPGAVELARSEDSSSDMGNKFFTTSTNQIINMTNLNTKSDIRFTAQASGAVDAVRVYVHAKVGSPPLAQLTVRSDSNGAPGGQIGGTNIVSVTSTGWITASLSHSRPDIVAGQVYHILVEYFPAGKANNANYISIRQSNPLPINGTQGIYPFSGVTADPSANTASIVGGNRTVLNRQPIYVLQYQSGNLEGNPYDFGDESPLTGGLFQGQQFQVTSAKTITAINVSVRKNSNSNPADSLYINLDNVDLSQQLLPPNTVFLSPTQPTTTFANYTYTLPQPITLQPGTNYRLYLRSPGSAQENTYLIRRLNNNADPGLNPINFDGTNSKLALSFNSGAGWGTSDVWDLGSFYFRVQTLGQYSASGDFTSHSSGSFDAGTPAAFNSITWSHNTPANTTLRLQVAISNDSGGPWDYFGSDGNIGSYFGVPGPIPLNKINGQYLRYKATFTSDGSATPTLNDVSINFSP